MQSQFSELKRSGRYRHLYRQALLLAAVAPIAGLSSYAHSAAIFTDNFSNGSTANGTSTPGGTATASSTSYDIAANRNQSPATTVNANDLEFGIAGATSAIEEAQAIFTSSPVTFAGVGDTLDYQVGFTDTGLLLTGASSSSQISFGIYSSGGTAPLTGLNNTAGVANTSTGGATGGVAGWKGYVSENFAPTTKNKLVTRPAQSGTNNTDQDLIGNNASSSSTYGSPAGVAVQTASAAGANLAGSTNYFNDFSIELTAANTYTIIDNLYQGTDTTGTLLDSTTATGVTGANFYNGFDGLAIGYRQTTNVASQLDVSSIAVTFDSVNTPEPASLSLVGVGAASLLTGRGRNKRKRRKQ